MNCHIDDLPLAWQDRIVHLELSDNPRLMGLEKGDTFYRKLMMDAWFEYSMGYKAIRLLVRLMNLPFYYLYVELRRYAYRRFRKFYFYNLLKNINLIITKRRL
jgi:hypothetical protein